MDDLIKRNDVLLALCEKKCGCVLQECGDHPCWIAKMIIDIPAANKMYLPDNYEITEVDHE